MWSATTTMRLPNLIVCLVAALLAVHSAPSYGYISLQQPQPIHHHATRTGGSRLVRCRTSKQRSDLPSSPFHQHTHYGRHPTSSTSLYFLKRRGGKDGLSQLSPNDGKNNSRLKNLRIRMNKLLTQIITYPKNFRTKFAKLSKRGKQLFIIQLLFFTLIFGSVSRKAYVKFTGGPTLATRPPVEVAYSNFLDLVENNGKSDVVVDNVKIGNDRISYRLTKAEEQASLESYSPSTARLLSGNNKQKSKTTASSSTSTSSSSSSQAVQQLNAYTRKVNASPQLIDFLRTNDMPFSAAPVPRSSNFAMIARSAILLFYFVILYRMYKVFTGNMGAGNSPGEVPGKLASPLGDMPLASFNDIQGIDDAKLEVMELVDTLRYPDKYAILGARAPTGLLLEGPPGTGKTMLARATAATAGVPLLYCSGSDFVEMFVGRGAARVRKLFERASKLSPCIIFIDELDALGKSRDSPSFMKGSRGNDEAEQTLNQLLACMDGLDSSRRICVLAATNRKEILDTALIRPGRFDRIVTLKLPDAIGREKILRVHASKLPGFTECTGVDDKSSFGKGTAVDLSAVAAVTGGLSGAELEFIVNESAIRAVRRVSAAIKNGEKDITPNVLPIDFAASVANFFETRRPNKDGINDLLKSVWK